MNKLTTKVQMVLGRGRDHQFIALPPLMAALLDQTILFGRFGSDDATHVDRAPAGAGGVAGA